MISTHTTMPYTTKTKFTCCKMDNCIIDTTTTKATMF